MYFGDIYIQIYIYIHLCKHKTKLVSISDNSC